MPTPEETLEQVQRAIKTRRLNGETLEKIADDFGVHWTTIHHWENGRRYGRNIRTLLALANEGESLPDKAA